MSSDHLDHLRPVSHADKRLGIDNAIPFPPSKKLVPPPEKEITSNQLEPRSKRIACRRFSILKRHKWQSRYRVHRTLLVVQLYQRICDRGSRLDLESHQRQRSGTGCSRLSIGMKGSAAIQVQSRRTFMFSPHAVRRSKIMDPCQILELINRSLLARNAEFMFELPGCCYPNTQLLSLDLLLCEVIERMGAASVGPHIRECDLL
jgi:hypothetical protein